MFYIKFLSFNTNLVVEPPLFMKFQLKQGNSGISEAYTYLGVLVNFLFQKGIIMKIMHLRPVW